MRTMTPRNRLSDAPVSILGTKPEDDEMLTM
jgi:hypothetical protein